jgi:hypothetical protein
MKNPAIDDELCLTETQITCPYSNKSHVSIDFHESSFIANPELTFQKLRNTSPIQQIVLDDNFPIWLISTFEDTTSVLRDP